MSHTLNMKRLVSYCVIFMMISCSSSLQIFNQFRTALLRGLPSNDGECFRSVHKPSHIFQPWAMKTSPCATTPAFNGNTMSSTTCGGGCNIPTMNVTCEEGFYFSDGSTTKTIPCLCDGWGEVENCTTMSCDTPMLINADVEPAGPYSYPDVVNVTCITGYNTFNGSQSYQTECRSDGTWSMNIPCISQTCSAMEQNNTKLKDGMLPRLFYPTSIIVVCAAGYLTSEAADCYEAMCLEDGTWNFTDACDYSAEDACAAVTLLNTVQSEIPMTVDGGTFEVVCNGSETLTDGSTSYTAACTSGTWNMTDSCGIYLCETLYDAGATTSGVYTINPDGMTPMEVYCENELDDCGWTVIQRRVDGTTDFFLDWAAYKAGFGNASTNYWLGLDNIRLLTKDMDKKLKVYMRHPTTTLGPDGDGYAAAEYGSFYIDNEAAKYTLHVDNFTDGGAGDSLAERHNGQPFTTKDVDNDDSGQNCAVKFKGAFWHKACHYANPNGLYTQTEEANGMNWFYYTTHDVGLTFIEMMIKTASGGDGG